MLCHHTQEPGSEKRCVTQLKIISASKKTPTQPEERTTTSTQTHTPVEDWKTLDSNVSSRLLGEHAGTRVGVFPSGSRGNVSRRYPPSHPNSAGVCSLALQREAEWGPCRRFVRSRLTRSKVDLSGTVLILPGHGKMRKREWIRATHHPLKRHPRFTKGSIQEEHASQSHCYPHQDHKKHDDRNHPDDRRNSPTTYRGRSSDIGVGVVARSRSLR